MDFSINKAEFMVQKVVRDFSANEIEPIAYEIDEFGTFPHGNLKKMQKIGITSIPIPECYGGVGGTFLAYYLAIEEVAKKCATTSVALAGSACLCAWPIMTFGNDWQKEKFLRPIAEGKKTGGFALTEPGAGSDASQQRTIAKKSGEEYILNGTKCFITGAGEFDIFIVIAKTNPEKGIKGLSAFIVKADTPGFSVGKIEDKMGIRGSATGELIFQKMKIPKENLLGKEGDGFKIAMQTLDGGRIAIAAQAVGIAQGAMDAAVKYLDEREQFGRKLKNFQGLQWYIAEMETEINAARNLYYHAAYLKKVGKPYSKEAAMAKLFASKTAMFVTNKALQIHGGYGYMKDYPLERMLRDAKITEIYEGTSEIQKIVIASHVMKK